MNLQEKQSKIKEIESEMNNNNENLSLNKPDVSSRLLLRIAADLQKELLRQTDDMVKADFGTQIEGLKVLHKEVEDYRTIKRLLITDNVLQLKNRAGFCPQT